MKSYTPGPWEINTYGDHREIQQVDPDGISIAVMSAGNEADARLMAASPELLAACIEAGALLARYVELQGIPPDTGARTADVCRLIGKAILKAKKGPRP